MNYIHIPYLRREEQPPLSGDTIIGRVCAACGRWESCWWDGATWRGECEHMAEVVIECKHEPPCSDNWPEMHPEGEELVRMMGMKPPPMPGGQL